MGPGAVVSGSARSFLALFRDEYMLHRRESISIYSSSIGQQSASRSRTAGMDMQDILFLQLMRLYLGLHLPVLTIAITDKLLFLLLFFL